MIKKGFMTLDELEKMFHMFSNSIDNKILAQCTITFEKSFLILFKELIIIDVQKKKMV